MISKYDLENGAPGLHDEYKGIEWVENEIKRIKTIDSLKEQIQEAERMFEVCFNVRMASGGNIPKEAESVFNNLVLLCDELRDLKNQPITDEKNNPPRQNKTQLTHCSSCRAKSTFYHLIYNKRSNKLEWSYNNATDLDSEWVFCNKTCFNRWWKTNQSSNNVPTEPKKPTSNDNSSSKGGHKLNTTSEICAECKSELELGAEYYYNQKKNDNKKLCSTCCYDKYYKASKTNLEKKEEVFNTYETIQKELFEKYPVVLPEEVSFLSADAVYKLLEQEKEKGQLETYLQQKLEEIRQVRSSKGSDNVEDDNQESRIKNQESRIKNQESRIKNHLQTFSTNSISTVELTSEGDLLITYQSNSKNPTTVKETEITPDLQKLKSNMQKNNQTKLTKTELEQQLKDLELERKKLKNNQPEQNPKDRPWGLIIGGSLVGVIGLVGIVMVVKSRKKKKH